MIAKPTNKISRKDIVLLFSDERRNWLVEAGERKFHTHKGIVDLEQLVGRDYGSKITSSLGEEFFVLRPTTFDFITHVPRPTQIMYPKDIGLICLRLGLTCGKTVLEAGTGSGAMTIALAASVQPDGHVYTYEMRKEFAARAKHTLKKAGLLEYVTIRQKDAREGFEEQDVDAAMIDLADPWAMVKPTHDALRGGATMSTFSPTINQTERMVDALNTQGFINTQTFECILRPIRAEPGRTRPVTTMIAHTGYITFATKTLE